MPVRFRFCGDDEVPDWVLAAVNEISILDSSKIKSLAQTIVERTTDSEYTIEQDKKLTVSQDYFEHKVALSALDFMYKKAVCYEVSEQTLSNELQQIGLPHEHALVVCQIYTEHLPALKQKAKQLSLRCSVPKNIQCSKDGDRVRLQISAWQAQTNAVENYDMTFDTELLSIMVQELKSVYERVENAQ